MESGQIVQKRVEEDLENQREKYPSQQFTGEQSVTENQRGQMCVIPKNVLVSKQALVDEIFGT